MSTIVLAAGLATAIFWGFQSVLAKRGLDYGGSPHLLAIVVVVTGNVLTWGVIITNTPTGALLQEIPRIGIVIFLVGGIVGTALGRLMSYSGVDRVGASISSTVVATSPVFATVLARIFLRESVSVLQAVGIIVVVSGVVLITTARGGDLAGWERWELLIPLVAAVAYGSGYTIRRYGLVTTQTTAIEAAALNEFGALVVLGGYAIGRREFRLTPVPRKAYGFFVATGVVSTLGLIMLFVGLHYGNVAVVATLAGTSALFATFFSYLLLRDLERVTRRVVLGAGMVVVGVSLITLS